MVPDNVVGEYQERTKVAPEMLLPLAQAPQIVTRRPVFPELLLPISGRKASSFHIDEPRGATPRCHDEIETLERTVGNQAAALLVDGHVCQSSPAQKRFEGSFVVIFAIGQGVRPDGKLNLPLSFARHYVAPVCMLRRYAGCGGMHVAAVCMLPPYALPNEWAQRPAAHHRDERRGDRAPPKQSTGETVHR